MRKLTYIEKVKHKGKGGFNFWNTSISFGIVGSTIMKFINCIADLTLKFSDQDSINNNNNDIYKFSNNNYRYDNQYVRLSKYPTSTNITMGI